MFFCNYCIKKTFPNTFSPYNIPRFLYTIPNSRYTIHHLPWYHNQNHKPFPITLFIMYLYTIPVNLVERFNDCIIPVTWERGFQRHFKSSIIYTFVAIRTSRPLYVWYIFYCISKMDALNIKLLIILFIVLHNWTASIYVFKPINTILSLRRKPK